MTYIAIRADHAKLLRVRKRLRRKGNGAYVPAIVTKRLVPKGLKTRRKRRITPLMGYILVKVPEMIARPEVYDLWLYGVLETKDVRGYVALGDVPARIPVRSVQDLKDAVAKIRLEAEASRHRARLSKGGRAAIKSGSLAGKIGTVDWIKGKRVGLEAKLFGTTRVIEVAKDNLEAA